MGNINGAYENASRLCRDLLRVVLGLFFAGANSRRVELVAATVCFLFLILILALFGYRYHKVDCTSADYASTAPLGSTSLAFPKDSKQVLHASFITSHGSTANVMLPGVDEEHVSLALHRDSSRQVRFVRWIGAELQAAMKPQTATTWVPSRGTLIMEHCRRTCVFDLTITCTPNSTRRWIYPGGR